MTSEEIASKPTDPDDLNARAARYANAVRDGVQARWSFPDPPGDFRFGREMLASLIEELATRNAELTKALEVAEIYACEVIDDAGHPDQRIIKKALRREGYNA